MYEEIIEKIAIFIINEYWNLQIQYANDNSINTIYIIPNKTASAKIQYISSLINTIKEFSRYRNFLSPLEVTTILYKDLININLSINKDIYIMFYNLPKGIKNDINKLLFSLDKYNRFITKKNIYLTDNISLHNKIICEYNEKENNSYIITNNLYVIKYNIIYALLKDKLIDKCNHAYWQKQYTDYLNAKNNYNRQYLFSARAEIDCIEFFMNYIIIFILQNEQLYNIDLEKYEYINHFLN